MTIYFDTSAILKMVLDESGAKAVRRLVRELADRGESPGTSWLGEAEFRRSTTRHGISQESTETTIAEFDVFEIPRETYEVVSRIPIRELRTLDALHIATAIRARAEFFVSYDRRQCDAAATLGLSVVSP